MSQKEFAKLCEGTAGMLEALAKQCKNDDTAMVFSRTASSETIRPLLQIITAINESQK